MEAVTVERMMLAEQRYRAAILALRDGQWEQAALHLLELMAASSGYRNASEVLTTLEKTRAVAYWRAAFAFALERRSVEHAEAAINKLSQLAPGMPDLPQMRQRLRAAQAGDWRPPAETEQPPPEPGETATDLPSLDEVRPVGAAPPTPNAEGQTTDPGPWPDARARQALPASGPPEPAARQPVARGAPPTDTPPDNGGALSPRPMSLAEILDEEPPRVLKSALFTDSRPDMSISAGPVYDALTKPRALKTPTFLDETGPSPPAEPGSMLPPLAYETRPHTLPESPPPPTASLEDTRPVPTPAGTGITAWASAAGERAVPVSTDEATVETLVPGLPETDALGSDLKRAVRSRPYRRLERLAIILLGILLVAILAMAVVLNGPSGMTGAIDPFGGVQSNSPEDAAPAPSPAGDEGSPPGEVEALIRAIDTQVGQVESPEAAVQALRALQTVVLDLTDDDSPLQAALLAWLEAGDQSLNAALQAAEDCPAGRPESPACTDAQTAHRLLAEQTAHAREAVCALTACPNR